MKTTHKIFSILVILMTLILTGMNSAMAQVHAIVTWSDNESCACPFIGEWVYRVDIAIIDQCGDDPVTVYEDYQVTDSSPADFTLDYSCLDYTLEPCYLVVAAVKKLCPDGHGGFIVVCECKNGGLHKSCNDLIYGPNFFLPCGGLQ